MLFLLLKKIVYSISAVKVQTVIIYSCEILHAIYVELCGQISNCETVKLNQYMWTAGKEHPCMQIHIGSQCQMKGV